MAGTHNRCSQTPLPRLGRNTQGTWTTHPQRTTVDQADPGSSPTRTAKQRQEHHCHQAKNILFKVYNLTEEALRKIWTDQAGRFPKQSSRGNQYIMVLTKSDSLAILVETMKNRSAGEIVRAYQALINCLNATGIFPLEHILNNKCPLVVGLRCCVGQPPPPPSNYHQGCGRPYQSPSH